MRKVVVLLAVLGCSKKQEAKPEAVGSGSGSSAPVIAADAASAGCDLAGGYRLKFDSNGSKGWWLRLNVQGDDVQVSGATDMLGLEKMAPTDVKLDRPACTITIAKTTKQAGDLKIALTVADPKVTGTLSRTDQYGKGTTPITGVHDVKPEPYPACIKPGVYSLRADAKKWKTINKPKAGPCDDVADLVTPNVRVEMYGGELQMDYAAPEAPYGQDGGGATLTKTADCEYDLKLEHDNLSLPKAHIVFAGDTFKATGVAATIDMMEETDEGENQATCEAKDATVEGKRLGDL